MCECSSTLITVGSQSSASKQPWLVAAILWALGELTVRNHIPGRLLSGIQSNDRTILPSRYGAAVIEMLFMRVLLFSCGSTVALFPSALAMM